MTKLTTDPKDHCNDCHSISRVAKECQEGYYASCQETLQNISHVRATVDQLKNMNHTHYPFTTTINLKVFQIENNEQLLDSTPKLFTQRLSSCLHHLDSLSTRVADTSSKILVTGDLNSGKSTLVNALLKQDILPVDQQPCTSMFCQVISSDQQNTVTTVHAIQDVKSYSKQNADTFHVLELRHLYKVLTEAANQKNAAMYKMLKIYVPRDKELVTQNSLLHNGVVDIALIDSPGLNTDSIKTTAIFARQEEIDVVVFVVGAENHFTLSGKEFLSNAASEKTHIFIVVNRFDNIHDKSRCKRLILEQIKELSLSTYEQADNLVHFVSASQNVDSPDFVKLEQKLRSFVLYNRTQSKLVPAKNYLQNVLRDVYSVAAFNESKSGEKFKQTVFSLETNFLPGYSSLVQAQKQINQSIQELTQKTTKKIGKNISVYLEKSVSDIGLDSCAQSVPYPGLILTWQYAQNIADSLTAQLENNIRKIEIQASQETVKCIEHMNRLTLNQLKEDVTTGVREDIIRSSIINKHHPVHIKIEVRDLLLNRKLVDDKKVLASSAAALGTTTLCFKLLDFKGLILSYIGRYINPLDDPHANLPSRCVVAWTVAAVGFFGISYTAYSFISSIPHALQTNLKNKFKAAVEDENLQENQTHRIKQGVQTTLETKQAEIMYRINEIVQEKKDEKKQLEDEILKSRDVLDQFKQLADKCNDLLTKVEHSLSTALVLE